MRKLRDAKEHIPLSIQLFIVSNNEEKIEMDGWAIYQQKKHPTGW